VRENRRAVLAALRRGQTIGSAARRGGIGETVLRERMAGDAAFAAEVEAARREGRERRADELEAVLFKGAMKVATDPRYTAACIFALCNLDPEHWRNTQHQRVESRQVVEHDLGDNLLDILDDIVAAGDGRSTLDELEPAAAGGDLAAIRARADVLRKIVEARREDAARAAQTAQRAEKLLAMVDDGGPTAGAMLLAGDFPQCRATGAAAALPAPAVSAGGGAE